jgi:hypothetical protein
MFYVRSLYLMALAALVLMAITLTAPLYAQDQTQEAETAELFTVPLSAYAEVADPGVWVSVSVPARVIPDPPYDGPTLGPVGQSAPPGTPIEIRLVIDPADFCATQP